MIFQYGKHEFHSVSGFFAFLELTELRKNGNTAKRIFIEKFCGKDHEGFSIVDKDTLEKGISPCRLSPDTQKIRGVKKIQVSPESLNAIFALAMSLEHRKMQEQKAEKQKNNRFCKMRIAKR